MNVGQKLVVAVGAILIGLRAAYPVKVSVLSGLGFSDGPDFLRQIDWKMTWLHIAAIAAVSVALVFILKTKKS